MSSMSKARVRTTRGSPRRRKVDTARMEELLSQAGDIVLAEGFTTITMDELATRLGCSKATLYSVAGTKEQLVQTIARRFFIAAAEEIERAVAEESDPRQRIRTYLTGVGTAMRRQLPAFYDDMVSYEPTARIYRKNSDAAASRVHEMIDDGVRAGAFRDGGGIFAAQVVAIVIDAVQSGSLLRSTELSAGDAFAQLGDLILDGLSRPARSK